MDETNPLSSQDKRGKVVGGEEPSTPLDQKYAALSQEDRKTVDALCGFYVGLAEGAGLGPEYTKVINVVAKMNVIDALKERRADVASS